MIRWRKIERGAYAAETAAGVLAEVHNTSQTGTENYPWDWYLTDLGLRQAGANARKTSGVADSLRSAKSEVEYQFLAGV